MKKFNKIKRIMNQPLDESRSFRKQEDDEVGRIKGDIEDQRQGQEQQSNMKPSGDDHDKQQRAPVNPDGSPVSMDDIKDRMPEKGLDNVGGTGYSKIGIGTHGSEKRKGIIPGLMRTSGRLKSMADVAKKGAPVLPVAEDLYEDEEGNLRRFGKITTARAAGNPYYFEFDHYDKASGQNLVLYGTAPGSAQSGSDLQPITLKVKTIVPQDKMDVRPMTAPTNANVQSNFVSESKTSNPRAGAEIGTTVDGKGNMTTGTMQRGPDGRFRSGNQSGVQYAPKETNPPAIIPGGTLSPAKIESSAYSLSGIMSKGGSYSTGGGGGGSSAPATASVPPPSVSPSIQTIRKQYKPEYSKQKGKDRVNIPKNLWYHPSIQRMIKRFIAMNKQSTRIKIGGNYGMLVRSDPGDGDSRLKLVRKIPRTYIPKIFLDDDFIAEIIEFAPIPPNLPPNTAMAAIGLGLTQTMGLPMSASRSEAKQAIAGLGNKQPAASLGNTQSSGALTNDVPSGSELSINPPAQISTKVKQESLLDNDQLNYLIYGIDESFLDWLGTTLGKGANVAKNMYRRGRIGIKKMTRAFEKETGKKLNDIDYENIMNRVKWILGTQSHEQPEWSGDIKGGPDDVDLDPDNNVDFVGDARPDPAGHTPEPKPTPEQPDAQKPEDTEQGDPETSEEDQPGMSDEKLEKYVTTLINGYAKCTLDKPKPSDMLNGPTEDVVQEADILDVLGRVVNDQTRNAFKHFAGYGFWPDFTEQDLKVLFVDTDYGARVMGPSHGFAYQDEKARQEVRHQFTTEAMKIRTELGEYYNVNTWKGSTGQLLQLSDHSELIWKNAEIEFFQRPDPKNPPPYWKHSREKYMPPAGLNKYDSVLQYLARDVYTRYKVNILSPSYQFKLKHFKEQVPNDPMDHDIKIDPGKMHTTPTGVASSPKQGKFFDKGNSSPGQFGHELGKKVDAAKQAKQKQRDKDRQKKARPRRRRSGKKRLEESFDSIRKLVTGN